MYYKNKLAISVSAVTMTLSTLVHTQQLEEIIVTGTKRPETLQDIPLSVSSIGGDKLQAAGLERIEDLSAYVPNLTMTETGIGTNIFIRGIGSGINQGFEQSVGMYVDGVYYGRAQLTRAPFLDLERVEVLRGPQSVVLGKNSIAGAINITTRPPGNELAFEIAHLYEPEYNENKTRLIANIPFSDRFRSRFSLQNRTLDNYTENLTPGSEDPERDEKTYRGTLSWDITDDLTATLKAEYGTFDVVGRNVEIMDDTGSIQEVVLGNTIYEEGRRYSDILRQLGAGPDVENTWIDGKRSSNGDFSNNTTKNLTTTLNYNMNGYAFASVTGFMGYEYDESCDCDFTGADLFNLFSDEEFRQFSQEFRVVSPRGEVADFIAGLYYQSDELDYNEALKVSQDTLMQRIDPAMMFGISKSVDRVFESESHSMSAFGQLSIHLSDTLDLTFGLRTTREKKKGFRSLVFNQYDGSPITNPAEVFSVSLVYASLFNAEEHEHSGERLEKQTNPSAILEWNFSDNSMLYFSYKEGSKSGGFDARSNSSTDGQSLIAAGIPRGTFEYEDERASSFEIGSKTALLDNRLEVNVALYRTTFEDMQVSIFDGRVGFNVGNAGEAVTQGIEIDGRWQAMDNLLFNYSLAYSDFEFTNYPNGQCYLGQAPDTPADPETRQPPFCDYEGKENQYIAPLTGFLGANYSIDLGNQLRLKGALDVIYSDEYLLSPNLDPDVKQDAFYKLNARLALAGRDENWEVALVGKNLTDETTVSYANETPIGAGSFKAGTHYAFVQPPRTVAIQGMLRF